MTQPYRFQCSACDEWHEGIPDLGFDAPHQYASLSAEQRTTIASKTDDLCTIEDDYFVRGVIELPIVGHDDTFGLGAWVSLSKANFARYVELFRAAEPSADGPYFGWLCNSISGYPDTLFLKTNVHLRPHPKRPLIELEPTDHPLAIHQRKGISLAEVQAIVELALHPGGREALH